MRNGPLKPLPLQERLTLSWNLGLWSPLGLSVRRLQLIPTIPLLAQDQWISFPSRKTRRIGSAAFRLDE